MSPLKGTVPGEMYLQRTMMQQRLNNLYMFRDYNYRLKNEVNVADDIVCVSLEHVNYSYF